MGDSVLDNVIKYIPNGRVTKNLMILDQSKFLTLNMSNKGYWQLWAIKNKTNSRIFLFFYYFFFNNQKQD